ncbi:MAG: DNA gyrase subunit A [Patescibacteria group bacterium]
MASKKGENSEAKGSAGDSGGGEIKPVHQSVVERNITTEMKESYLDYAMSVITARALPDVRDGLKPVHRRILFAMHERGLTASAKFRKSAVVVGDVLGSYHPHGDVAVYDSLVKMAQDFSTRYPLALGQGNFGNIDGDPAAAMRYTETKMSRIAGDMLRDIDKGTVDWRPNYDSTRKEPVVMPSAAPNLVLNGTLGIAVGMASNIPPHNLGEVAGAVNLLIDKPEAAVEELMEYIKGPDFPTGGVIFNRKDITHAYSTGRGGIVTRGIAEIVETKSGTFQIVISAIPYRVNKSDLIIKIADLVREKKIEGIKALRDESTRDIRIVIDLKNNTHPQQILNTLYKHTQLEDTFHCNFVALVDGVPQTLSLKSMLTEFIAHRKVVVRRRTEFDLKKAEDREHILLGLSKALDHIDKIIKLIKASKDTPDAHRNLMKEFGFSAIQATAILEMRLQKLAGLERKKIEDELAAVQEFIKACKKILASVKIISDIVKTELKEVAEKHGDARKTNVLAGGAKVLSVEDLVPEEENALVLTAGGYIKRTNPEEFRKQRRGGVGVVDLDTKDEDFVTTLLMANTHSDVLFFTNKGRVFQIKMYELPEGKRATKGKSILNYIALADDEKVTSVLTMPKEIKRANELALLMITKQGVGKKVKASSFHDVRRSGLIAIKLAAGDSLVSASFVDKGDSAAIVTAKGQSIRFKESDIREMGRGAGGVRAMKLGRGDTVIAALAASKSATNPSLLIISENGYGKKTELDEYKIQKRGGSGIKTSKVTPKTGDIMSASLITDEVEEVVAMSQKSQVIRLDVKEIPSLGRQTQGVRIMKLREKDKIASLICF